MAPERIDPQRAKGYDVRSDVWSLGITLMEVATGKFPYPKWGSVFEQLYQVVQGDPPRITTSYNDMEFSTEFVDFVNTWWVFNSFLMFYWFIYCFIFSLIKEETHRPKYSKLLQHPFILQGEKTRASSDVAAYITDILESMANNGNYLLNVLKSRKFINIFNISGITQFTTNEPAEVWME